VVAQVMAARLKLFAVGLAESLVEAAEAAEVPEEVAVILQAQVVQVERVVP